MTDRKLVLKATDLHKAFYNPTKISLLKGVCLEAYQRDTIAIMGRSGEGKSTLLHILGTLDQACSGSLMISNQQVSTFNKTRIRNRNIGFVFQSFHLLDDYTVLENVLMPARIGRQSVGNGSEMHKKALDLLETVGLSGRAKFNTKLLSGGEKQRVSIARALFNDPDLILADEPSGNLDHQTSLAIQELLLGFARERNKALIVVTHDKELAKRCDKLYYLHDGLLVEADKSP